MIRIEKIENLTNNRLWFYPGTFWISWLFEWSTQPYRIKLNHRLRAHPKLFVYHCGQLATQSASCTCKLAARSCYLNQKPASGKVTAHPASMHLDTGFKFPSVAWLGRPARGVLGELVGGFLDSEGHRCRYFGNKSQRWRCPTSLLACQRHMPMWQLTEDLQTWTVELQFCRGERHFLSPAASPSSPSFSSCLPVVTSTCRMITTKKEYEGKNHLVVWFFTRLRFI